MKTQIKLKMQSDQEVHFPPFLQDLLDLIVKQIKYLMIDNWRLVYEILEHLQYLAYRKPHNQNKSI